MAEMLKLKGVDHVYPSLLAKIENGQREVKLDEAVAIADLLGLSIDTLLGRTPSSPESDTVYALRLLAGTSQQWCRQVWGMSEALHEQLAEITVDFTGEYTLADHGHDTWNHLVTAFESLLRLTDMAKQLLEHERHGPAGVRHHATPPPKLFHELADDEVHE